MGQTIGYTGSTGIGATQAYINNDASVSPTLDPSQVVIDLRLRSTEVPTVCDVAIYDVTDVTTDFSIAPRVAFWSQITFDNEDGDGFLHPTTAIYEDLSAFSGRQLSITANNNPAGVSRIRAQDLGINGARNGSSTALDDPFNKNFSIGIATGVAADTETLASGPTITDINTNNEFTPDATNTLNGTNLSTSGGSISIDGEAQTITSRTATAIEFTGVRGGNPYNTDLTLTYTDADSNEVTQTVQQVPQTGFAVTAASPNTTDPASLWSGLVDTSTGDPVTVVDGDQALVTDPNNLGNLAVTPAGEISADTEGDFTVQFWRASEGVWGSDQTVTFEVPVVDETAPTITSIDVPTAGSYKAGDVLTFTSNFSESVDVTGTPAINFSVNGSPRQANYSSGTGSSALVFTYTVQSGDDTSGLSVTSLSLDGGAIADTAGNAADITLVSVGDTPGIIIDTIAPTVGVENVTTTNTAPIISGTASGVSQVSVVVNAVTYTPSVASGSWSQQLPTLAINTYPITVDATDDAGNVAVQDTATLSIVEAGAGFIAAKANAAGNSLWGSGDIPEGALVSLVDDDLGAVTLNASGELETTNKASVAILDVAGTTKMVLVRPVGTPVKPFYKVNWQIIG